MLTPHDVPATGVFLLQGDLYVYMGRVLLRKAHKCIKYEDKSKERTIVSS